MYYRMPIIHHALLGKTNIYILAKRLTDAETAALEKTYIQPDMIDLIIDEDADVYDEGGVLLAKFRKSKIARETQEQFYNALGKHVHHNSRNRSCATGTVFTPEQMEAHRLLSRSEQLTRQKECKSNIFGFFDSFGPSIKYRMGSPQWSPEVRTCAWNYKNPERYLETIPFIKEIDNWYAKLVPEKYAGQKSRADEIHMKIADTAFSTVTTNINFQTALHTDKGDDPDGFGNLTVIQYGEYKGGETCLVQWGVGFNVRSGDLLYMDVHKLHGNLPFYLEANAIRCSVVCYLRIKLWQRVRGWTAEQTTEYINRVQNLFRKSNDTTDGLRSSDTDI